jgi:hypothetical protein
MLDEEEEWTTVQDDQKVIAGDLSPEPQERVILEIPTEKKESEIR